MLQELETVQYKYNALIEENKRLNKCLDASYKEKAGLRMTARLLRGELYRINHKCKSVLKMLDNKECRQKYSNVINMISDVKNSVTSVYTKYKDKF